MLVFVGSNVSIAIFGQISLICLGRVLLQRPWQFHSSRPLSSSALQAPWSLVVNCEKGGLDKFGNWQRLEKVPSSISWNTCPSLLKAPVSMHLQAVVYCLYDFMPQIFTWNWGVRRLFLVPSHPTRLGVSTTAATLALFSRPLCTSSNSCPTEACVPTAKQFSIRPHWHSCHANSRYEFRNI